MGAERGRKTLPLALRAGTVAVLAGALYYHDRNRRRLEAIDGGLARVVALARRRAPAPVREGALRALVALT